MSAEVVQDILLAAGAFWGLYLLVTGLHDGLRRYRRRPWWREPQRGDYVRLRGKL